MSQPTTVRALQRQPALLLTLPHSETPYVPSDFTGTSGELPALTTQPAPYIEGALLLAVLLLVPGARYSNQYYQVVSRESSKKKHVLVYIYLVLRIVTTIIV